MFQKKPVSGAGKIPGRACPAGAPGYQGKMFRWERINHGWILECKFVTMTSQFDALGTPAERCWSGRTGLPAKQLYWQRYRGFESPPLRHKKNGDIILISLIKYYVPVLISGTRRSPAPIASLNQRFREIQHISEKLGRL